MKIVAVFSLYICLILSTLISSGATPAHALGGGTLIQDVETSMKATVVRIIDENIKENPGLPVQGWEQTLEVKILDGEKVGQTMVLVNDYIRFSVGDELYVRHIVRAEDGKDIYMIGEPDRIPVLGYLALIFIVLVFAFGGIQGIRGLVSLAGSFALIIYVLLPGILGGYSALLMSILVSSLIIIAGSYITHGFKRVTTSAVIGMIITVIFTGLLAHYSVELANLSGFESDESVYLNSSTQGTIDLVGLLLGGIIIGLLGVLYDVAIGQAVAVEELHHVAPHMSRKEVYRRAIRIGREHIGALVDTLAIAYVGASLPLLLLFYHVSSPSLMTINREVFSVEIIRTLVGSIGIVLAVPITTAMAVWILVRENDKGDVNIEVDRVGHHHHHHSHS